MKIEEGDYLAHYGILRRSGRYPWGSGGPEYLPVSPNKRNKIFIDHVNELKSKGVSESMIAKGMGTSVAELRATRSIALNQQKQANIAMAERLKAKGVSQSEIGRRMNVSEGTIRNWLAPGAKDKSDLLTTTANMLKNHVDEKKFVDVGSGVENWVGVSRTKLDTAIAMVKEMGYALHIISQPPVFGGQSIKMQVLCPPGTTQKEAWLNRFNIQQIADYSEDGGRSFVKAHPPMPINPKRVGINYSEDGGGKADGVIYIRPGVKDVSLGDTSYAQVRVQVGDNHYIKGMAMYKTDLPDGVDLVFNTSKSNTGNKFDAMKGLKDDPELPFGSITRQVVDNPGKPNEKVTSVMNIVGGKTSDPASGNIEGNWATWSKTLSSQMLSKQEPALAKSQLNMTYEARQNELASINRLTNATVKKRLLEDFAQATDSASVHLKAASLPRQGSHVILPVDSLPDNQIYAPNFINGERVVLIRHPHGGTFEIPELTVNNRHPESKALLGDSRDAVGINHNVAKRLSGADFDGDTVLVIPNNQGRVKTTPALEGLKNFDPISAYPSYPGMKPMRNTQTEMGKISNLITDMSLQGAPPEHLARAIKHSMVVIDAEKHNLNYKLSYNDNNIKDLREKYQSGGASTLISRAGARPAVPERQRRPAKRGGPIDVTTGARVFEETGRISYKTGKPVMARYKRLDVEEDARALLSKGGIGTPMERIYADHSNRLKALANEARLTAYKTPTPKYSPSAKKTYANEVESLNSKLAIAKRARPLERQAQLIANATIRARFDADPNMDDDTRAKIRYQSLDAARTRTGSKKAVIKISDSEWDAIQAGAISNSKLEDILRNADMEIVREHATPSTPRLMSPAKINRAAQMFEQGYSRSEVAAQLGVSVSTLDEAIQQGGE